MNARVERSALHAALRRVLPAVGRLTGSNPVLRGVRIEVDGDGLELCCTDFDLAITTRIEATGDNGVVVVPAAVLTELVGRMADGAVRLNVDGERLAVVCGETEASLICLDASTWPRPAAEDAEAHPITAEALDLIQRVALAASTNDKRPELCVVCFEGGQVIATDSYRAHIADLGLDVPSARVPTALLSAVTKNVTGAGTLAVGKRTVTFATDNTTWTARLAESDFPAKAIRTFAAQEPCHTLTFEAAELLASLRRVLPVGQDSHVVALAVDGGKARISAAGVDTGEATDTIAVDGSLDFTIGFDAAFLAEAVAALNVETVTFGVIDRLKSVVAHAGPMHTVLMPVNLDKVPK